MDMTTVRKRRVLYFQELCGNAMHAILHDIGGQLGKTDMHMDSELRSSRARRWERRRHDANITRARRESGCSAGPENGRVQGQKSCGAAGRRRGDGKREIQCPRSYPADGE